LTRPRKKLLIGFVAPIVLLSTYLIIEHFRGPWLFNRWKAEMTARGETFDIARLARPTLPPDQNGLPHLTWLGARLSAFPVTLHAPAPKYAAPGKVIVVTKLNEWPSSESRGTNTTWVKVAEELAGLEAPMQEALEILANERFSANLQYHSGFSISMSHLSRLKAISQALQAAALHDLHQGQDDAAFAKLNGMLALVEIEKEEPILISQLVRVAVMNLAFSATWQALQDAGWSDAQLAQLQETWAKFAFLRDMEKSMAMERVIGAIEYERFRTSDLPLSEIFGANAPTVGGPPLLSVQWLANVLDNFPQAMHDGVYTPVWKFAWSHHDELHYCKIMQRMINAHREVLSQKAGAMLPGRIERIEQTASSASQRMRFPVASMLYPALTRAFQRAWIAQSTAELATTGIAIKRYALRYGAPPGRLEELVPQFLAQCPIDYMDGRQLKYCRDGDFFLLYSVGIDGKDDGGDGRNANPGLPNFQNGRDLIWPQPASEEELILWRALRK
jgi:hypothetical protein